MNIQGNYGNGKETLPPRLTIPGTKSVLSTGSRQYAATGFSIGTKGYIGTGTDGNAEKRDLWEWDGDTASPTYDTWTEKASMPGLERIYAVGFSLDNQGFIGTGTNGWYNLLLADLWMWDQATDSWTQMPDLTGPVRDAAVAFTIMCNGYLGTGGTYEYTDLKDFWEFCDTCYVGTKEILKVHNFLVFPNPARYHINIKNHDLEGEFVAEISNMYDIKVFAGKLTGEAMIDLSDIQAGFYILTIFNENNYYSTKLIIEK